MGHLRVDLESIAKVLRNHNSAETPIHNTDANSAELRAENVCPVAGRVHQTGVRDLYRGREGKVFAGSKETYL
jgi:hypothetical protein